MSTRKFEVEFSQGDDVDTGTIELDERVIEVVDDAWRADLYDLYTPEDIAAHIAYNMVVNGLKLSEMDGWADMPDEYARMIETPHLGRRSIEVTAVPRYDMKGKIKNE